MTKSDYYNLLIDNGIYSKIDINETKVFEYDVVIDDVYENSNKKFKVETNAMTKEDIIIALLAKQTLYIKNIRNITVFVLATSLILCIISSIL